MPRATGCGARVRACAHPRLDERPQTDKPVERVAVGSLDLLAEQAIPWRDGKPADVARLRALQSQISQNFAHVNAQADAVLFEIGPLRQMKLAQRRRLLDLQPGSDRPSS